MIIAWNEQEAHVFRLHLSILYNSLGNNYPACLNIRGHVIVANFSLGAYTLPLNAPASNGV
ncbi:hypothetical protein [Paenibacillus shirakamiensis]|uniref:hypothetical protein n=1 Tax=Paenibacillus shirakamiensis TaxID=1265935 RepID=UPI001AE99230|nr:hypothetical protein [Paenibacillus shirakamiensis]